MTDLRWPGEPFAAYAKKANSIAKHHPAPLIGAIRTRREAMEVYVQIIAAMNHCASVAALQAYLDETEKTLLQFHAELDFLWTGDGADFAGLDKEIERAFEAAEARQFFSSFGPNPKAAPAAHPVI